MIYCHSPGGVTAAALEDGTFYTIYAHHHSATLQEPWRSLRSLSVLFAINFLFLFARYTQLATHQLLRQSVELSI